MGNAELEMTKLSIFDGFLSGSVPRAARKPPKTLHV
jgi:hypothetical protein